MKCYEMFELQLQGPRPEGSWAEAEIRAEFCREDEKICVRGFYDGEGIYKVRFLPQKTGTYHWSVEGAVEASGTEICEAAPFNKVRHCVFPKHYDYNHNDPRLYPFEKTAEGTWDVHHPCMAYWQHFEQVIQRLGEMGIQTDLILFHVYDRWGFALLSMEECRVYLDYLIRRLAAFPYIWWSMANEYDLLFNRTEEDWYEIEKMVAENDPYHHLLSCHNCLKLYDFSRPAITHCSVQTDGLYKAEDWMKRYGKPVVYDEMCYEGDIPFEWGNISGFEMVNRFWCACSRGAYATHGETFLDPEDILWWAKGGTLKGESTKRIAFLKEILESLPRNLEPWEEPFWEELSNITVKEGAPNPFFALQNSLNAEEKELCMLKGTHYCVRCGDEVFLKYYARQCSRESSIRLPKDRTYRIEILDVWNMTRELLTENASGKTMLRLPGKEGIAVLATAV